MPENYRFQHNLLPEQKEILIQVVSIQTESILSIYQRMDSVEYHDYLMDNKLPQDQILDNLPLILMEFDKIKENPEDWEVTQNVFFLVKLILKFWVSDFIDKYGSEGIFLLFGLQLMMSETEFNITINFDEEGNTIVTDNITKEVINENECGQFLEYPFAGIQQD